MNQQGGGEGNVALVVENLQTLDAARSALANDIAAASSGYSEEVRKC